MRAARTPPEPAPMTNRSTSRSAMVNLACRPPPPAVSGGRRCAGASKRVSLLAHFGAELADYLFREPVGPVLDVGHALFQHLRLKIDQFLAERRLVERYGILDFL